MSANNIDTKLANNATLEQLGPFVDKDARVTLITTMEIVYLPVCYVAIVISQVLTPWQA